jgi:hypothetical protein
MRERYCKNFVFWFRIRCHISTAKVSYIAPETISINENEKKTEKEKEKAFLDLFQFSFFFSTKVRKSFCLVEVTRLSERTLKMFFCITLLLRHFSSPRKYFVRKIFRTYQKNVLEGLKFGLI